MTRDPFLDNAKFLLMVLVVYGHAIEPLAVASAPLRVAYAFIYLFHIPCFAALAGALTKARPGWGPAAAGAGRLLLTYAVFQVLYWAFRRTFDPSGAGGLDLVTPDWVLWFLVSLCCWRLLLPAFATTSCGLPAAVALGLAAGAVDAIERPLSLSRTVVFFPFFLAGHLAGRHRLAAPPGGRPAAAVAGLLLAGVALGLAAAEADVRWLYGRTPYSGLGVGFETGVLARGGLYLLGAVGAGGFLAAVPRGPTWFTPLGANTLYAFLLHAFLVRFAVWHGWYPASFTSAVGVALLPLSVATTALLSSNGIRRLAAPLVEVGAASRSGSPSKPPRVH